MTKFNAAFKKWFGDSKIVDSKGNPLVVYHGTNSELFNTFDLSKLGARTGGQEGSDFGMWGMGFYFTPTKKHAYGDKSIAAYLSIQNPLIMVSDDEWPEDLRPVRGRRASEALRSHILSLGYDGVIHYDHHPDRPHPRHPSERVKKRATQIAAFFPEQIKSIDNDGTWDADDPDIRSNPPNCTDINPLGRDGLKDEANAYARRQDVKDAIEIVRSHQKLMRAGGWGTFKARLWSVLFPGKQYPGLKWDVPLEFIYAQKVTSGWTRVDAYRQVIRGGR